MKEKFHYLIMLPILLFATYSYGQTLSKYAGAWYADEDYFYIVNSENEWVRMYPQGALVNGFYHYYEKDGQRIKHGSIRISTDFYAALKEIGMSGYYDALGLSNVEKYVVEGQYEHGKRNGKWVIYPNEYVANSAKALWSSITLNYINGELHGAVEICEYKYNTKELTRKITFYISDGKLVNNFYKYVNIAENGQSVKREIKGMFDENGNAYGTWEIKVNKNGIPVIYTLDYVKGILLSCTYTNQSTGTNGNYSIDKSCNIGNINSLRQKLQSSIPHSIDFSNYFSEEQKQKIVQKESEDISMEELNKYLQDYSNLFVEWGDWHWIDIRNSLWKDFHGGIISEYRFDKEINSTINIIEEADIWIRYSLQDIPYYIDHEVNAHGVVYLFAEEAYRMFIGELNELL